MSFHCDKCGLCCQLLTDIPQLAAFDRGDGVCRYLVDNLCSIYENRPEVCNVDKMYAHFASQITRKQYDELMEDSCKIIKKKFAKENAGLIMTV